MNEAEPTSGGLRKVTLSLEAGQSPTNMNLTSEPRKAQFILGLGVDGMTPFEYELIHKRPGDMVTLKINRRELPEMLGHICLPLTDIDSGTDTFYLRVTIEKSVAANQTEIIKQMAALSSCHGDCCGH